MNDNHELLDRFTRAVDALALAVDAEIWDDFKREANAVAAALRAFDALALAVDAEIWDDFKQEADAVTAALRASDRDLATARAAAVELSELLRRVDEIRAEHRALPDEGDEMERVQETVRVLTPYPATRDALEDRLRAWLASVVPPPTSGDDS